MMTDYNQASEQNEYRFFVWEWIDAIAKGLTAGDKQYPGQTWKQIPAKEHAARAIRHLVLYLQGDRREPHLVNASMRLMMAFYQDARERVM